MSAAALPDQRQFRRAPDYSSLLQQRRPFRQTDTRYKIRADARPVIILYGERRTGSGQENTATPQVLLQHVEEGCNRAAPRQSLRCFRVQHLLELIEYN